MIKISFRILNVCKKYLAGTTKSLDMAFYVSAIYLTRPDVKDFYLTGFINWAHEVICPFVFNLKITVKLTVFISNRLLPKIVLSSKKEFFQRWPAYSNMGKANK
jgi:hypothetical protein